MQTKQRVVQNTGGLGDPDGETDDSGTGDDNRTAP